MSEFTISKVAFRIQTFYQSFQKRKFSFKAYYLNYKLFYLISKESLEYQLRRNMMNRMYNEICDSKTIVKGHFNFSHISKLIDVQNDLKFDLFLLEILLRGHPDYALFVVVV